MKYAVNKVEMYSEKLSQVYIVVWRCYLCGIIVLNLLSPPEDKEDDTNDGFGFRRS
jgi:hypothetical protein